MTSTPKLRKEPRRRFRFYRTDAEFLYFERKHVTREAIRAGRVLLELERELNSGDAAVGCKFLAVIGVEKAPIGGTPTLTMVALNRRGKPLPTPPHSHYYMPTQGGGKGWYVSNSWDLNTAPAQRLIQPDVIPAHKAAMETFQRELIAQRLLGGIE